VGNDKLFRNLCTALGADTLGSDERFLTNPNRVVNRDQLIPLLEETFNRKTRDEWLDILAGAGVPAAPVYSMHEVFSDPQVLERGMLLRTRHPTAGEISQIGVPMKFSKTPAEIRLPPPKLGIDTSAVLSELLGYTAERINNLRKKGVI
jgi:formyl-CoA transferase